MLALSPLPVIVSLCATLVNVVNAAPSGTSAAASPTSSQPGCPSPISIKNGGFESGKIAPWTLLTNSNPTTKQKIVSPSANKSKYALRADFAPANITEYSLEQGTTGQECFGYYYKISYSWNWLSYTGPEGAPAADGDSYCAFSVGTGYTDGNVRHYGSRKPGWHHHSYIGRDVYSHCRPAYAAYVADVTCVGGNTTLPGFSMLFDNFSIERTQKSPNPPPPATLC